MGWTRIFRRKRWHQERTLELDAYLDAETSDNLERGLSPQDARNAALRKLGNPTLIREEIYRMNTAGFIEAFWQNLRYGFRLLRKSPGFTSVAILSLALGIGANTAAFSLIHAVLLRPLPYPEPGRLVRICKQVTFGEITFPEYEFWKEHASAFVSAAAYRGGGDRSLTFGSSQEWIRTMNVTAGFFRTLAKDPVLGREFNSEETRAGGPLAIVLSDGLWRRAFNADPSVLGRAVTVDGAVHTVVGILPAGFWFPQSAEGFVPLRATGTLSDSGTNTQMIARLKTEVGVRQAESEMPALAENFGRAHPDLVKIESRRLTAVPFHDWLVRDVRLNLLLLFGAVGLLLLIGCSNLAGLLLARLAGRQKEIAMRMALGSSRGRLLGQFLVENALVTLVGGLAGVLGARALLDVLVAVIPFGLPASAPIRLDAPVLAFTFAIAVATGVVFSFLPLWTASRLDLLETLKAGGRSMTTGPRQRTRSILVVSEVALSTALLVSAGLLIQSLYRLHQERLGFNPQGLITFTTPVAAERRRNATDLSLYQSAILQRLQAVHGVTGVAAINVLPLAGYSNLPTEHEGHPDHSIGGMEVRAVTPRYFELMGIPIRQGRPFVDSDSVSSQQVILVNETLARQWWPGGNPVGDQVVIGRFRGKTFGEAVMREVVGVIGDTKTATLKQPPRPTVYVPAAQMSEMMGSPTWILRGSLAAVSATEVRRAIAEIDSRQRIGTLRPMDAIVASTTASSRFDALLFGFLAGLALILTTIGLYGLLSFSVALRTNEIGTRMALGASRGAVLRLVLRQGFTLVVAGLLLGLAGALVVTRSLATLLYGVRTTDPMVLTGVSVLLLCIGLLASYVPALRATRVDPIVALRQE